MLAGRRQVLAGDGGGDGGAASAVCGPLHGR